MKTWTLRFRKVDKRNFDEVRSGEKPIETRAASVKYQSIAEGDTLVFVCGNERFSKRIKKRHHWPSVDAMVAEVGVKAINPSIDSVDELKAMYATYPGYEEKIKQFGLLGFELE